MPKSAVLSLSSFAPVQSRREGDFPACLTRCLAPAGSHLAGQLPGITPVTGTYGRNHLSENPPTHCHTLSCPEKPRRWGA